MITFNFTLTDADAENLVSILNDAVVAAMMEVMDAMAAGRPIEHLQEHVDYLKALKHTVAASSKAVS